MKRRREGIVRRCVQTKQKVVVIVLGAGHDLSGEVRLVAPGWDYVRVTTETVAGLVGR